MKNIKEKINQTDWQMISQQMDNKGFALIPEMIDSEICQQLIKDYDKPDIYRKTIIMEQKNYGLGEYKYFNYPLPDVIQTIREEIYPRLAPIANNWMNLLKIDRKFPEQLSELQKLCHENNQTKPTPLILKYGKTGFNMLHQDLYGEIFFPIQIVLFLNQPDDDYTGGEFVLTEKKSEYDEKAIVLKPKKGDLLMFTTSFRPEKAITDYKSVQIKHGVSEIHQGIRHTLGIIFHDADK